MDMAVHKLLLLQPWPNKCIFIGFQCKVCSSVFLVCFLFRIVACWGTEMKSTKSTRRSVFRVFRRHWISIKFAKQTRGKSFSSKKICFSTLHCLVGGGWIRFDLHDKENQEIEAKRDWNHKFSALKFVEFEFCSRFSSSLLEKLNKTKEKIS